MSLHDVDTDNLLVEQIRSKAKQIGFDLVGIASAKPSVYSDFFRQWLAAGRAGTMHWLGDRLQERTDPAEYFPGAKSVISVACNYRVELPSEALVPLEIGQPDQGRVARYAWGQDYHIVMKDRLHDLADWLRAEVPGTLTRSSVDTAPVMEKELAARAGIGWMGKNTCIINEKIGSFILLGQILTTLELPGDDPVDDRCGSCTRCLDACPTQAITSEYQMDASRCISYLTIEHREQIAADLQPQMGNWIYGCDICQEVCPWNRKSPATTDPAFQPRFESRSMDLNEVMKWSTEDYRTQVKNSAMKRVKLPMLQRNAEIAIANGPAIHECTETNRGKQK